MQFDLGRGQGRIAGNLSQGRAGGIGAGETAQQTLHRGRPAEPLNIGHQGEAAIGLAPPAEAAIPDADAQLDGLGFITESRHHPTPSGGETQLLETAGQTVGIAQHGWQDGEVGHEPRLALANPNRDDLAIQWPMPPIDQGQTPLRVGVMASGEGSNFEALVAACRSGAVPATVVQLVVNNPGCGAQQRAARLDVPCVLHDHRHSGSREALDRALVECFATAAVDLVVMAGWMRIVTPVLIEAFGQRLINIHPSLLPSFRGVDAVGQALAAGVTLAGCSVHLVSEEVDAGEILMQAAVPVLADDDHASLSTRIQAQEHRLLPAAVALMAQRLSAQG